MTWNPSGHTHTWESEFLTDSQKCLIHTSLRLTDTEETIRKINPTGTQEESQTCLRNAHLQSSKHINWGTWKIPWKVSLGVQRMTSNNGSQDQPWQLTSHAVLCAEADKGCNRATPGLELVTSHTWLRQQETSCASPLWAFQLWLPIKSAHRHFGFRLLPYSLESYNGSNFLNFCLLPYLPVILGPWIACQ